MQLLLSIILFASFLSATPLSAQQNAGAATKTVSLIIGEASHPRIAFGAEKLTKTLVQAGYTVKRLYENKVASASKR